MQESRIKILETLGQSIWIDYIRRDLITGGGLRTLIEEDGLLGMTSNPAIFEKAILESSVYDALIRTMSAEGRDAEAIYEALSQGDVRDAADLFRPVYDKTGGRDGYVSLEVNPHLAHDTEGTVAEARRLWAALDRKNVLIKVPATAEGLPAIRRLIAEGISVNVTLIFGVRRYLEVADAYLQGLRDRIARNEPVRGVVSVASFFLSRIDSAVDPILAQTRDGERAYGQVAVASAKAAYQAYRQRFEGSAFSELRDRGAGVQRLLWASTGTKNPRFGELKYVEPLIGRDTVSTLPVKTFEEYLAHGDPKLRLEDGVPEAEAVLASLPSLGIDLDGVIARLEAEGIQKFIEPFDKLMATLEAAQKTGAQP